MLGGKKAESDCLFLGLNLRNIKKNDKIFFLKASIADNEPWISHFYVNDNKLISQQFYKWIMSGWEGKRIGSFHSSLAILEWK